MSKLLSIRDLHYSFPQSPPVLQGVNLEMNQGSFSLLAGRNGSGKTLLMGHLNGLIPIQRGEIYLQDVEIRKNHEILQKVGLVFQNADSQFVCQSVFKEIAFGPANLRMPKGEIKQRSQAMLELMGLKDFRHRNPHSLSGGEKRRLAMASVLVMEPSLLVLDEPFTGLDLKGVEQTLETLLELHSRGVSILLITHDVEKCLAHADRLFILDQGVIAAEGEAKALLPQLHQWDIYNPWQKDRPLSSYTWLRKSS